VRKLLGGNDVEDALKKLDVLTMEEARMAISGNLNATHSVDNKVTVLIASGQETLQVTNRVDGKMSVLIDGGLDAFSLVIHGFLTTGMARYERKKRSHMAVCRGRR